MSMFAPLTWNKRPATWLRVTAIFELGLAAVFAVIGYANEPLRGGFYLTAAILGGVGLLLLMWARRMREGYDEAQRLRVQGVPGTARVVAMTQTGMFLNEQPQVALTLEVTTDVHGVYQAQVKEWVPLIMLGRLTSGQPLPVKVDPSDAQKLVIEWEAAMSPMAPTGEGSSREGSADVKARLLATGVSGTATVLKARRIGDVDAEGRPVYDLDMEIDVNGTKIRGPARVGIPPEREAQLEAGDTVPIKADPANPSVMAVDWDSA